MMRLIYTITQQGKGKQMAQTVLLSVSCADRTGLVADVAGELFNLGANLGDTAFSVLGTGAELTSLCDLPDDVTSSEVEEKLKSLDHMKTAEVSVTPFDLSTMAGPEGDITHIISVKGGDRPGLIARLCEVFVQFKVNVVRLNSRKTPGSKAPKYEIIFSVSIPDKAENSCLATVTNTAGELSLSCQWEKLETG
ncbi:MAG: amino acid-binding protein [Rhodospirillales bacterium]|nr:amino acid-binding protein [Rhodospirillales bacterium]